MNPSRRPSPLRTLGRGAILGAVSLVTFLLVLAVTRPLIDPGPEKRVMRGALRRTLSVGAFDARGWPIRSGTAVAVGGDLAVTCLHVVEDAKYVTLTTPDGVVKKALAIVDTSRTFDLALVRVSWLGLDPAELSDPDGPVPIFSLGFSKYTLAGEPDVVHGRVRASSDERWLEHAPAIAAGFSGGGVFDESGLLVGINASRIVAGDPTSYAAPSDAIRRLLARASNRTAVHVYPDADRWPRLWWEGRGSGFGEHAPLVAAADSLVRRAGVPGDADSLYRELARDPVDPDIHVALLIHHLGREEWEAAQKEAALLESLGVGEPIVVLAIAIDRALDGDYDGANELLDRVAIWPSDVSHLVRFVRGTVGHFREEPAVVFSAYRALRRTHPELAGVLLSQLYPNLPAPTVLAEH